ncbi:hypothetical protein FOL47_002154 [Perkinsus chesapeaki]|uniref:Integrase catalytic domain-containing protein n=1 Tax=Perkinsus chesapeaki TaxID=330153 RepID=A0A7J6KPY5_PERCH|nr:hypothetical protein FOL47_002154 [Perkinsus chesapeaki]
MLHSLVATVLLRGVYKRFLRLVFISPRLDHLFVVQPNDVLDFLGPMKDCEGLDQDPNNCPYIALMVDCATNFVIGCPVSSTSTNCVIYALLQWIAVFGRPKVVQLDSPPTHSSEELRRFLEVMDITRSLGISRRPQCQGRVENVVKEIKIALKCNSIDKVDTLPWWVSVQCAICVHNNARSAPHNRSPTELCFGTESPILELPSTTDSVEGKWEKLHSQIADDFFICNAIQSDDAHRAEMAEIAHKAPFRVYSVGDKVRLSRLEDGKRVLRGPFTVTELNDSNPFLYRLDGWSQGWVSLNQLLPFKDDSNLELFNHAVRPHQAYSASIFRLKFPDDIGIPLDEVSSGDFIIYPVDENVSDDGEPHRTIYIMEVMDRDDHILHALSLNRDGKNRWVRPPVRDRQEFMWDIDDSAILGAFKPTRTRRLPMKVSSWLSEHGAA